MRETDKIFELLWDQIVKINYFISFDCATKLLYTKNWTTTLSFKGAFLKAALEPNQTTYEIETCRPPYIHPVQISSKLKHWAGTN